MSQYPAGIRKPDPAVTSQSTNTAPSIGPLLGALLATFTGWRWIFWLLAILSASCWLAMILSLPETAREVVGNGSTPGSWVHKVPLKLMRPCTVTGGPTASRSLLHISHFLNPFAALKILLRLDSAIVITSISVLYSVSACTQASLSTLVIDIYRLNQVEAGLVYLPYGIRCVIAALLTGKQLDKGYRKTARKHGLPIERERRSTIADFPIEEARLRNIWWLILAAAGGTAGYGWSLEYGAVSSLLFTDKSQPTDSLAHRRSVDYPISSWKRGPSLFYGISSTIRVRNALADGTVTLSP